MIRANHPELIEDVADGKRFVWLGSGISLEQVPDVVELIARVLRFLRDQAASGEADAEHHRTALLEILDEHLPTERARYENDRGNWEPAGLDHLRDKYSRVLGVGVEGKPTDYLLIDGAGLPELYGDPDLGPGPTHRLLAMLISEGVVTHLASGNWDTLVEKALLEISATDSLLDVYVDVDDPRTARGHAEIAKFHGCAGLARTDPDRYRDKIIATTAQISKLHGDNSYAHMTDHLRDLTTRMRSLVLGLSVQDSDLLAIFRSAASRSPWKWESNHPAYLFAEPFVSPSQRDVLEVAYGEDFGRERTSIVRRSAIGAYAGPVVAAILIEVLAAKLGVAIQRHQGLPGGFESQLKLGIRRFVLRVVAAFGGDEGSLADFLLTGYSDFLRTYLGSTAVGEASYLPFARGTTNTLATDISVIGMGIDRLAIAIGLLGFGEDRGRWRAALVDEQKGSRIMVSRTRNATGPTLVVVRGAREAVATMTSDDWVSGHGNMVLLQMELGGVSSTRSPGGRIGRGRGARSRRQLMWDDISDSVHSLEELMVRFETGVAL
ncbi:SIR2 family protein [Agromyces albus]|uniref:SIR2 family protein n=1 Tax=Agromyces albus TaxID=205332 RepID=UPI0013E92C47|nr:SIR2 family protein [Agromyces albus]